MSRKTVRWTARGLWMLTALAVAPMLVLASVNGPSSVRTSAFAGALILAFASAGALISSRRPGNPIGWLFLSAPLPWFRESSRSSTRCTLFTDPGTLPAGAWAGWFGGWARGVGWFMVVLLPLLLFPMGRLPSPRWRPAAWGALAFVAFFTFVVWLAPVSEDPRLASVANPLGVEWEVMNAVREVEYAALLVLLLVCAASVVVRFRGSRGDERQQLKWFAYAAAVMVVLFASWFSLTLAGFVVPGVLMWIVPLLVLPVGIGIAILKYRLYDIDVVISRTLVYGTLTATLVLIYASAVASIQTVSRLLTGQEQQPQLAVVVSTLAIAALFNPLRRRVQELVDRRFYRKRYDARQTLDAFAARLRNENRLDDLTKELLATTRETMEPAHVSLWLRTPAKGTKTET